MANTTEVSGKGIRDGSVQRRDLDITTTGESVVTRLVAGTGITLSATGADSGTGEVTITATSAQYQANNTWLGWRTASDLFFLDNLKVDSSDNLVLNAEKYFDDLSTPGPDVAASNILFQINKQNALSLTSTSTLKFYPTNFLIHGITSDGADEQSITITPADTADNFSARGASARLFGNEHALSPGYLILESGVRSNSVLVLNASATNGQIQLKIAGSDVLTVSPLLISAKQNVTILPGNVNNLPLSFTGDTNTGLFSAGADSIGLVTGGQSRLIVNDSGLVGLSENVPGARLHVNAGASSTKGLIVKGAASQSSNLIEAQDSSGAVVFSVSPSGIITGTLSAGRVSGLAPVATSGDYNDLTNTPNVILQSEKGVANGVATLNSNGLVPTSQLPSYVDDVVEYANLSSFPVSGAETGKIYVAQDTNKIYRWSGSTYIEVSPTAGTSDTAIKLATPRNISASGDATWSVSFDGSTNVLGNLSLSNSGVTAGTYTKLTVDDKGRATSGTLLAATDIPSLDTSKIATGIFDAARIPAGISITGNAATATKLATARTINGISFDGTANIIITANTSQFLTFGDGLNVDSFNGSVAKTIAVDSTVVRTSGNQTIGGTKTFSSVISGSITGSASNVTGTVAIANGGTGQTTPQLAINALTSAASASSGQILTRNSSGNAVWAALATVPISTGGTGATTAQTAINALTASSSATTGYVLTKNSSGDAVWAAPTASTIAASAITGQTGMWSSTNRPGPYRLYRRDVDDPYNVQTYWTGSRWRLYGYYNDTAHADTHVGYADAAPASGITGQTGMWTSANRPGPYRLYRREDDSNYSVQTYWTGSYWRLYGYNGDSAHADVHVGYADTAGSSTFASNASSDFNLHRQNTGTEGGQINFMRAVDDTLGWMADAYNNGTTPNFRIINANAVGVRVGWGQQAWGAYSDERLKKNLLPLSYGLSELMNINPIRFDLKSDENGGSKRIGFSGQNIEAIIPEACYREEDDRIVLCSTELIPVLVNAVKQLNSKVIDLEARVASMSVLEARIADLEAAISNMNTGT